MLQVLFVLSLSLNGRMAIHHQNSHQIAIQGKVSWMAKWYYGKCVVPKLPFACSDKLKRKRNPSYFENTALVIIISLLINYQIRSKHIFFYFQSMCRSEKKSLKGYFLAGRNVTWWPVRCTLQYISILISPTKELNNMNNMSSTYMSMHK